MHESQHECAAVVMTYTCPTRYKLPHCKIIFVLVSPPINTEKQICNIGFVWAQETEILHRKLLHRCIGVANQFLFATPEHTRNEHYQ
jgi:hypothetical protein